MNSSPDSTTSEVIDYSRKWYVLAAIAVSLFMAVVSGTIIIVALPTLVESLDTTFATVQWVLLSYLLTQTTILLSVARLGDMVGKKRVYLAGLAVFGLGSLLCGMSPNIYWLIGFRVVQGIGASMVLGLGMALITEAFPASERGKALGLSGTFISLGAVFGPTLGGLLVEGLSWQWVFWSHIPIGLIGWVVSYRLLPSIAPAGRQKFDYAGAGTLFVSLTGLLLALTIGQERGFTGPLIIGLLLVWLGFLAAFLLIEWRSANPIIDLRLFRNSLFSVGLTTGWMTFICMGGTFTLLPFYLENVLGYGPSQSGLLLATIPFFIGITAPVAGSLSDRFGTRPISLIGLVFVVLGYVGLTTLSVDTDQLGYALRLVPLGLGMGIFQSPNNSAIMGSVPRHHLGVASGMLAFTRTLGMVNGVALMSALWAARTWFHYAGDAARDVTAAPPAAQVAGMHDTFIVVTIFMALALGLSIWGLLRARQVQRSVPLASRGA